MNWKIRAQTRWVVAMKWNMKMDEFNYTTNEKRQRKIRAKFDKLARNAEKTNANEWSKSCHNILLTCAPTNLIRTTEHSISTEWKLIFHARHFHYFCIFCTFAICRKRRNTSILFRSLTFYIFADRILWSNRKHPLTEIYSAFWFHIMIVMIVRYTLYKTLLVA